MVISVSWKLELRFNFYCYNNIVTTKSIGIDYFDTGYIFIVDEYYFLRILYHMPLAVHVRMRTQTFIYY